MTNQIEAFATRFNGDVDITSDEFVDFLKAKLLGKTIVASHEVKKDQNGRERPSITRFEAHVKGSKKVSAPAKASEGEENWG